MRILLAAPDRDLLQCCSELLARDAGETVTAFDGTQVMALLDTESFDLALLDRSLPRIGIPHIIGRLIERRIPVVVLLNGAVTLTDLMDQPLACDFLSYPFESEELIDEVRTVAGLASSEERVAFGDMEIEARAFRINGGERVTAAEYRMLKALTSGERLEKAELAVYAGALNEKLAKQKSRVRIRYRAGEGYQLVQDE